MIISRRSVSMRQWHTVQEAILSQKKEVTSLLSLITQRGKARVTLKHNVVVAGDFPLMAITAGQRTVVISLRYSMPRKGNFFTNIPRIEMLIPWRITVRFGSTIA